MEMMNSKYYNQNWCKKKLKQAQILEYPKFACEAIGISCVPPYG